MAHLKVYENVNTATRKAYPYLLDIQSDLLDDLRTTVVIPLSPAARAGAAAIERLCPVVEVQGSSYVALTQQMAGIERKMLGGEVADLASYRPQIIAALDFIVSGF